MFHNKAVDDMLEDLRCNTSKRYRSTVGWARFLSLFKNGTHVSLLPPVGDSATVYRVSAAKVLRNQGGIWSGPQALLGFNEDSCFKTPCSEIIKDP